MGTRFRIIKWIIGLLFLAGFIWMLKGIEWAQAYDLFLRSNKLFILLAIIAMIISVLIKIWRFGLVTKYYKHGISFKDAALIQMIGISLAMITPGRIGEASKIFLLNKKGIPLNKSLSIMIFERLFDLFILGFAGVLFALFVVKDGKLNVLLMLFILLALILIFLLRKPHILCKLIPKRFEYFKKHVMALHFNGGGKKIFLVILLASFLTWFFEASLQWVFAVGMGLTINPLYIYGILGLSTLIALLSFLPAGIGAMDFSVLFLYSAIGVPAEAAISLLLVSRVLGTLFPILAALALVYIWKIPLKKIRHSVSITRALNTLDGNDSEDADSL